MSSLFVFKPSKKFIFNPRPKDDLPLKTFKEHKLSLVQKNFNVIKPVRPFNRFGAQKTSNSELIPKLFLLTLIIKIQIIQH